MKSRKLGIALLVMLAFVVTTGTFAYWASSVSGPSSDTTVGTITVGSGDAVTTSFTLTGSPATGGDLTPAGYADPGQGEVESVALTYGVQWTEDAGQYSSVSGTAYAGDLTVTYVITADNGGTDVSATANALLTVTATSVPASLTLDAASQNATWTVTMADPTAAQYTDIAGATITITFTWTLSNVAAQ